MTEAEPLQQVQRTYVRLKGRKLCYFAGCDYFRLASHPAVLRAVSTSLQRFGLNVAASRLTTGNHPLYGQLEKDLASFFGSGSALVVPTGYLSDLIPAQALAGSFSHVLMDERSHLALADAAAMLGCPVIVFRHRDPADLDRALQRCGPGARLIVLTDGMFAHDGSVAPLKDYLALLPKDALVLVDDAHGAGVLGAHGRGTPEYSRVGRDRLIQTVTLSKAFGVYGGAILCAPAIRKCMLERSRLFLGSTPLPLPLIGAARASLRVFRMECKRLRARLIQNSEFVKSSLRAGGFTVPEQPGPIIPVIPPDSRAASNLRRTLRQSGIHPPFIKYAGAPKSGYFRFVISSEHTRAQLSALINALNRWKTRGGAPISVRSNDRPPWDADPERSDDAAD